MNITKGIAKFYVNILNNAFGLRKQQKQKRANIILLATAGNGVLALSHHSLECFLSETESTDSLAPQSGVLPVINRVN